MTIISSIGEKDQKEEGRGSLKGISAVVAAVMLIAVTLLLVVTVSSWLTVLTKEDTSAITNTSGEFVSCAASGMVIEDVYLDFGANASRVTVRNTGQNTERILSAQLINTRGQSAALNTSLPINLTVGDIKTILFNINDTISSCANFSQARVASSCTTDFYRLKPNNC